MLTSSGRPSHRLALAPVCFNLFRVIDTNPKGNTGDRLTGIAHTGYYRQGGTPTDTGGTGGRTGATLSQARSRSCMLQSLSGNDTDPKGITGRQEGTQEGDRLAPVTDIGGDIIGATTYRLPTDRTGGRTGGDPLTGSLSLLYASISFGVIDTNPKGITGRQAHRNSTHRLLPTGRTGGDRSTIGDH